MMVSEPSEPPENIVIKLLATAAKSEDNGTIFLNIFGSFKFLNKVYTLFINGPFAFLKRNVLDAIQKNNGDNKYNADGFFTIFSLDANDSFANVCLYNWQMYPIKNNVTTININVKPLLNIKFMHSLLYMIFILKKINILSKNRNIVKNKI
jgi:hypothetical protein